VKNANSYKTVENPVIYQDSFQQKTLVVGLTNSANGKQALQEPEGRPISP
jgi:hypothetical protein